MKSIHYLILIIIATLTISCSRSDENEDVLSQEDISNIILNVKDDQSGITKTYNYTINSATNPIIQLENGKIYTVEAIFKNGNEDETESIISAKDEHFLIYDFQGSQIQLTRIDDEISTRTDGVKLGLKTKWTVTKATNSQSPKLLLTLIHDANTVSEATNGNTYGIAEGGETDAMATFGISN